MCLFAIWSTQFLLAVLSSVWSTSLLVVCVNIAGSVAFDFTCLLHTYFRVPDVTKAAVSNLRGCTFNDKVSRFAKFAQLHYVNSRRAELCLFVIVRLHCLHAVHKMRLIAAGVIRSMVCVYVCLYVRKKQLRWSRCRLGGLIHMGWRNHVLDGVKIRWVHLQPWGLTRRCDLLPNYFGLLLLLYTAVILSHCEPCCAL